MKPGTARPIGVAHSIGDEYLGYIAGIYSLLASDISEQVIAEHLLSIEVEWMGLAGTPMDQLLKVSAKLRKLQLPIPGSNSAPDKTNRLRDSSVNRTNPHPVLDMSAKR
jgi:hypothetical protein